MNSEKENIWPTVQTLINFIEENKISKDTILVASKEKKIDDDYSTRLDIPILSLGYDESDNELCLIIDRDNK